jgi:AraC-like DNA-binding protein
MATMDYSNINDEINSDYNGIRSLDSEQKETVSFHDDSSIRIWYNDSNESYDSHWHTAMEIIMPVKNYYDVTINEQSFHIEPGEVIIIPPCEMHSLKAPDNGVRFIYLINIGILTGLKNFSGIQTLLYSPIHITREKYPNIYDDIYDILVQMHKEYFHKNEYAELTIYSLLINMFTKLGYNHINSSDLFPNVRLYKQKEYATKFNEVLNYIDSHYMEDLTCEAMAGLIGFSKFHFSRLFKQYTNFTFCDYLNIRRIKSAESLLAEPEFSITEIALQSGFSSISTFNRIFKQIKGCTPSEYRTRNSQHRHH